MFNKKLTSSFIIISLVICSVFLLTVPSLSASEKEDDIEWVTADRIGHPDAEIVLTANIQRFDTVRTPFDTRKEYIRKKAEEWAKDNPNAKIELQIAPSGKTDETMSSIINQAEAGNAPDFAHIDSFWLGRFKERGILQPLNDYIDQDTIDDFFGFTKEITMEDDKLYGVWTQTDARVLYYRKDLIDNPPRTFDEVIETALRVKKEHGVHGYLAWLGTWEGAVNGNVWPTFWGQGGKMFDDSGKPIIGEGKNREALVNSLSFLEELVDTGAAPRMVASMTSVDPILAEVKRDNVAMVANGNWFYDHLKEETDNVDEKWDFVPLPQMNKDQRATSNGGWTYAVLTEDSEKQKLATDYIMTMLGSTESMGERCEIYSYLPTRKSVYEEHSYFSEDPIQKRFAEELEYGQARPGNKLYGNVSDLVQKALGSIITNQSTVEEAVDKVQEQSLKDWEEERD